ncbi:type IV leader peptidase family protein [Pseudonocardia kunmingensis]|uniref:Type IV leader peptidase family protein n=1 Tax=Pseudonocardia kunmingensis TaxID=630975 RepID=A0A543DPA1_9PSEU|nr:type IV leader peptidase family protein [Pseudonocardia kunmingensis]
MTAFPAATLAAVTGLAFGPVTLQLASATRAVPRANTRLETVAVTVLVGLLATACNRVTLAPLIAVGVAAAVVDLDERRLPNPLTGTFALGTALAAIEAGAGPARSAAGIAALVLAVAVVVKAVHGEVLGWGDIKLLPSLAALLAVLDPPLTLVGLVGATALLCVTLALFTAAGQGRGETVPYGPALVVGAFAAPLVT